MESEENQTQVSLPSHSPWKSLRDSHIPTAPTTSPFTKKQPKKRRPCGGSLRSRLQAHSSMRKCYMPRIRFLYIGSYVCSTLLSDPPSPERPCASLSLHLHQVVKRTCTFELSNMLGTQKDVGRGRPTHQTRQAGPLSAGCGARQAKAF